MTPVLDATVSETPRRLPAPSRRRLTPRAALLWAGCVVFLTVAFFDNHIPHANVNSQFALTCAIVERGTFSIDAYYRDPRFETIDMAYNDGHIYCDKSPVTAFLGVPVFTAWRGIQRLAGHKELDYDKARYWTTLLTVGAAAALLAMLTATALMRRRVPPARAALAGSLWVAATPLLGYSILFYSYLPACAMMLGSWLLVEPRPAVPAAAAGRRLFWGGALMGLAAWTLNTCAIVALVVTGVLAIAALRRSGPGGGWRGVARLWPWALGGVLGAAGYFVYVYAIFGAFDPPYAYEVNPFFRRQMSQGLMGATRPRLFVAWLLTFHHFQGIFRWFPLTALALAGALWGAARRRGARLEHGAALLVFALFLTYASAYYMWWGGFAYAPRHLIPALPLLGLGLAPWLKARAHHAGRYLFIVGLLGLVFNCAAVAVNPQPDPQYTDFELLRPERIQHWSSPFVTLQSKFWLDAAVDKNLGWLLGLRGRATLLPLAGVWSVALGLLWWMETRKRRHHKTDAHPTKTCN